MFQNFSFSKKRDHYPVDRVQQLNFDKSINSKDEKVTSTDPEKIHVVYA